MSPDEHAAYFPQADPEHKSSIRTGKRKFARGCQGEQRVTHATLLRRHRPLPRHPRLSCHGVHPIFRASQQGANVIGLARNFHQHDRTSQHKLRDSGHQTISTVGMWSALCASPLAARVDLLSLPPILALTQVEVLPPFLTLIPVLIQTMKRTSWMTSRRPNV